MPSEACNHRDSIYIDYAPDINLGGGGGGREGGKEGGREEGREGMREGGREGGREVKTLQYVSFSTVSNNFLMCSER